MTNANTEIIKVFTVSTDKETFNVLDLNVCSEISQNPLVNNINLYLVKFWMKFNSSSEWNVARSPPGNLPHTDLALGNSCFVFSSK